MDAIAVKEIKNRLTKEEEIVKVDDGMLSAHADPV